MERRIFFRCIFAVLATFSFAVNASFWEQIKEPSDEPVQSIGSYANGCLAGAHALPVEGVGYQVIRPERARYYGHQASIDFIESFASQFQQQTNKQLLIGDMSLAQGGRFSFGHSSHQNGLDIDIWFRLEETRLSSDELADPQAISLIDEKQYQANESNWQDEHFQMVKLAASNPEVARIFVHPIIKQKLCNVESSTNREWLRKVRPWWGHHVHMHVRLDCPRGDNNCRPQAVPPAGDGCGEELASWKPEEGKPLSKPKSNKPKAVPVMPEQCIAMLRNR